MADFFETLSPDDAVELASLSRLMYELRENHNAVLRRHGVDSPEALLEQICGGAVAEHPAYDHYLGACILDGTRHAVRDLVGGRLQESRQEPREERAVAMSLHPELADAAGQMPGVSATELKQDALILRLANGVVLTVHYAAPDAYSLRWTWGTGEAGIDTAPLHPGLATFPNHLHQADGSVVADPVTRPGAPPADNLLHLIRALLDRPELDGAAAG